MPYLSIDSFVSGGDLLEHLMGFFLQTWGFLGEPIWMPDLDLRFVGPLYIFKRCARFDFENFKILFHRLNCKKEPRSSMKLTHNYIECVKHQTANE